MIKINILNNSQYIYTKKSKRKLSFKLTSLHLYFLAGIFSVIFSIVFAYILAQKNKVDPLIDKTSKNIEIVESGFKPSNQSVGIVEDIVDDNTANNEIISGGGLQRIDYADMSFMEKVNYETSFAKRIFYMLSLTITPDVYFKNFAISDFKFLEGSGICSSKDAVIRVFRQLKNSGVRLYKKPYSVIYKRGNDFAFKLKGDIELGLDLQAPFLLTREELPTVDEIKVILKQIKRAADNNDITFVSNFSLKDADVTKTYKRVKYNVKFKSSYKDFVAFVNELYNSKIPCAFLECKLVAKDYGIVETSCVFLITVRR